MTTTASGSTRYTSLRAAWVPLAALCLAFFVEMVDNTLLMIALPTIGRDLGSSTTALQWVTGAYTLTFGGLLLTAGSIADRYGRRRVLLLGLTAFGLISTAVMAVESTGGLIAVRAGLGVAAAAMAPITNSLVFRLFDDKALKMRAMTLMIVVGMSGFILGPLLGGTALTHVSWHWLLLVNAPIALLAGLGVSAGVPVDRREDLTGDALDLPGALLSMTALGLGCYALTSGIEHGWTSVVTVATVLGAVAALLAFLQRERTTAAPMLDLSLFSAGPVRGAAVAQVATSIAMSAVMFGLILHFQYAYGWSPVRAGLANLPLIVTMLLATPLSEGLATRYGHRVACYVGAGLLASSLVGLSWSVAHGYLAIAVCMVVLTAGLRTVMTICAVALIDGVPANRTSLGAALNDTAQEVGTSVGTAFVGTLIALLVTTQLPAGTWSDSLIASLFDGERITYAVLAVVVGVVAAWGAFSLTNSRSVEERPSEPADVDHVTADTVDVTGRPAWLGAAQRPSGSPIGTPTPRPHRQIRLVRIRRQAAK